MAIERLAFGRIGSRFPAIVLLFFTSWVCGEALPAASLQVLIEPSALTVAPKGIISYTVTLTNTGDSDAEDVSVAFSLSGAAAAQTSLLGASPCLNVPSLMSCDLGTIAASQQKVIKVDASTTASAGSAFTFESLATSGTASPAASQLETQVEETDLSLKVASTETRVNGGDTISYLITVRNDSTSDAQNVRVMTRFPSSPNGGVRFQSVGPGCPMPANPPFITFHICDFVSIAALSLEQFTIVAQVQSGMDAPTAAVLTHDSFISATTEDKNDDTTAACATTIFDDFAGLSIRPRIDADLFPVGASGTDLEASMSVSPMPPIQPGDILTLTIRVINNGSSDSAAVLVAQHRLPPQVTFIRTVGCQENQGGSPGSATDCTLDGFVVPQFLCGTPLPGCEKSYDIEVMVNPTALSPLTVQACVIEGDDVDTDTADNGAFLDLSVVEFVDLSISKAAPTAAVAGTSLSYTLTVQNNGNLEALNVIASDILPQGLSLLSAPGCTESMGTVSCALGSLAGGASQVIMIEALAAPDTAGQNLLNQASVTTDSTDNDPANDSSTAQTMVTASADLSISKTGPSSVLAGEALTYSIEVTNKGPSNAVNLIISDSLPSGASFSSAAGCSESNGTVSCSLGSLAPGASLVRTIEVTVAPDAEGLTLSNQASVSSDTPDPISANNNSSNVETQVGAEADLSISKTGPASALAGGALTYTVEVTNNGPSDAQGVVISDTLPQGLSFSSAAGCSQMGGTVTCDLGTLAAGATVSRTIEAVVAPDAEGATLSNQASVNSDSADPQLANNDSSLQTQIGGEADLTIVKTGPATAVAGTGLAYQIEIANNGPSNATGVEVTDQLPSGLSLASAAGCSEAGGTVTCQAGFLAVGAGQSFEIMADVASSALGSLQNQAQVASALTDPAPGNNLSEVAETEVQISSELAIEIVDASASSVLPQPLRGNRQQSKGGSLKGQQVAGSGSVTYIIEVSNNGPSDALNVIVTSQFLSGQTLLTSSGCLEDPAGSPQCSLGSIAAGDKRRFTLQASAGPGGQAAARFSVSAEGQDPDPSNNSVETQTSVVPAIPTLSPWAQMTLLMLLGLAGAAAARKMRISRGL